MAIKKLYLTGVDAIYGSMFSIHLTKDEQEKYYDNYLKILEDNFKQLAKDDNITLAEAKSKYAENCRYLGEVEFDLDDDDFKEPNIFGLQSIISSYYAWDFYIQAQPLKERKASEAYAIKMLEHRKCPDFGFDVTKYSTKVFENLKAMVSDSKMMETAKLIQKDQNIDLDKASQELGMLHRYMFLKKMKVPFEWGEMG